MLYIFDPPYLKRLSERVDYWGIGVQALGPGGPNEPFRNGVRLRGLNRRPDDLGALRLEDRIKAVRKLAIPIANQKPHRLRSLAERPCDLSRLLRDPLGVEMSHAADQAHATAADFR